MKEQQGIKMSNGKLLTFEDFELSPSTKKRSLIEIRTSYADRTVIAVLGLTEHGAGGREQCQQQNHSMMKRLLNIGKYFLRICKLF